MWSFLHKFKQLPQFSPCYLAPSLNVFVTPIRQLLLLLSCLTWRYRWIATEDRSHAPPGSAAAPLLYNSCRDILLSHQMLSAALSDFITPQFCPLTKWNEPYAYSLDFSGESPSRGTHSHFKPPSVCFVSLHRPCTAPPLPSPPRYTHRCVHHFHPPIHHSSPMPPFSNLHTAVSCLPHIVQPGTALQAASVHRPPFPPP